MKKIALFVCGISFGLSIAFASLAAGLYAPVYQVNESIITKYELDQRIKMLKSFGTKGDLRELAIDQLIEDRLRFQAAKQAGITTNDAEIVTGMEEFAARGSFSSEQLLNYFKQRGVSQESFEDFVRAGILWRNVVSTRFASKVNISDNEVDAALDTNTINFPKTANLAEIILPTNAERSVSQARALADRLSESITTPAEFSIAAKKHSKSATAIRGGNMGWVPLSNLPSQVLVHINALEVGQVTAPINLGSALAIYQLRGIREAQSASEQILSVSYLKVAMPLNKAGQTGQITTANKLINSGDTCLDMQANTSKFGENAVSSQSLPASQVPVRIGAEIAKLDANEATYYVAENGAINVVMLCNRAKDLPEGAREQIRNALRGQRIGSFGAGYLQELRGDAIIIAK